MHAPIRAVESSFTIRISCHPRKFGDPRHQREGRPLLGEPWITNIIKHSGRARGTVENKRNTEDERENNIKATENQKQQVSALTVCMSPIHWRICSVLNSDKQGNNEIIKVWGAKGKGSRMKCRKSGKVTLFGKERRGRHSLWWGTGKVSAGRAYVTISRSPESGRWISDSTEKPWFEWPGMISKCAKSTVDGGELNITLLKN